MIVVANQVAVRLTRTNLFQRPLLTRLENTWWRDKNGRARHSVRAVRRPGCGQRTARPTRAVVKRPRERDGISILLWVFKITIDRLDAGSEHCLELPKVPDEDNQRRTGVLPV